MLAAVIVLAILLFIAVCLLAVMALWIRKEQRTAHLHDQFGNEYDRAVAEHGSRHDAERDLAQRTRRREHLEIRPLDAMQREAYAASWRDVQARFVDQPRDAVAEADSLVRDVMTERGYPMADFDQRSADLSVDHADVVEHYRAAHDTRTRDIDGEATTEELRAAMVHYRALFDSLLTPEPATARVGSRGGRS